MFENLLSWVVSSALYKIVGFIVFLFLPGFALSYALFPDEFDIVERIAMAVPFSFAVSSLTIFYLYYFFGVGITILNSVSVALALTIVFAVIFLLRYVKKPRRIKK